MKKELLMVIGIICHFLTIAQNFTDSNLPIVIIQSSGQNLDSAFTDKIVWMGIIDNGNGNRNYLSDSCNNYNGKIKINLHGSSKMNYPKKSWKFSLINNQYQNINQSILGMPSENDWILEGLYFDKSFLRNSLTYSLHREMGHYSPRYVYVELIVDGDYRGVYGVVEKIKRDGFRVNISKLWPNETSGDNLTGGYIFKLDHYWIPLDTGWFSNYNSNITQDSANYYLYVYPKPGSMPLVQKDYIKNFMNKFEQIMASTNFNDPDSGYYRMININSFIDFFLLNELSRNIDGYRLSSYFFKDKDSKGGKLNCGPMWDYDLGWDNCQFSGGHNPYGWQYPLFYLSNFIPFWWPKMINDPEFQFELRCRYQNLRTYILNENKLYAYIDSMANYLNESQTRNYIRWPIIGQVIYPAPSPSPIDFTGEISVLKNWIQQRINWLDNNIPGQCILEIPVTTNTLSSVSTYPNPFINEITVLIKNSSTEANCTVSLHDISGKKIQEQTTLIKNNTVTEIKLNTAQLQNGIYFLHSVSNSGTIMNKIIKYEN